MSHTPEAPSVTAYPICTDAIETYYADACEQFWQLLGRLKDARSQTLTHGEVEALIHADGMELLRRLIQGYFAERSAQEPIRDQVVGADGLVCLTPEYNYGIPSVPKNAIDWASRPAFRSPLKDKPALVIGYSMAPTGGARA